MPRRRTREITPERLLAELTELREAVSALHDAVAGVPEDQVIVPGSVVAETPAKCTTGILVFQPQMNECRVTSPFTAALYMTFLNNIGAMIDYLVERTETVVP